MTACVNRKHTKKVAAVVTASLVGALSLGAAPVAAVADTGIETLALDSNTAFAQGKLTGLKDEAGRRMSVPSDGVLTVQQNRGLMPTEVTPSGGADAVEITASNASVTFYKGYNSTATPVVDANGDGKFADDLVPGNYTMRIYYYDSADATNPYNGSTLLVNFTVTKAANLADAVLFDNSDGAENTSDTTFTYNADTQNIGVAIDGDVLNGPSASAPEYTIAVEDASGANVTSAFTGGSGVVTSGTYKVTITGDGNYSGQSKTFTLNVGKLDLSKADLTVKDQANGFSGTFSTGDILAGNVDMYGKVNANATYNSGVGSATVTVSADSSKDANITGSKTVEFNIVDKVLSNAANYDGQPFASITYTDGTGASKPGKVFVLNEGQSFKESKISVKDGKSLPASYYTVTYTDAEGNAVDASALQTPGVYKVKVRVNASACNYAYGSATETLNVIVRSGSISAAQDIVFNYDGMVGNIFTKDYDGQDFLDQLAISVKTDEGELVEGKDYTVKVKKGDEEVDSIVDAGTYTITLDIPGYNSEIDETDRQCTVKVNKLYLTDAAIVANGGDLTYYKYDEVIPPTTAGGTATTNTVSMWYLNYTGDTIEPAFELGYYTDKDGDLVVVPGNPGTQFDADDVEDYTWHAFPAEAVSVIDYKYAEKDTFAGSKDVDAIKDKGVYKVNFVVESDNFDDVNLTTENYITVSDSSIAFADVDPNAWYAQSVFQAKQLGYIKGISGSNIYSPMAPITRADALVIISRMSGFDQTVNGEDYLSQNSGYLTRYSDVDPGTYYAKAVAWATKVGIVHGYDDGTFQPMKSITREEFATMLANYAKAMGKFTASDGTALDGMSDADSVSDWAEESVAWAVANKVMGNKGFVDAQSDITRAEVAAMAVNYQPEKVTEDIIG